MPYGRLRAKSDFTSLILPWSAGGYEHCLVFGSQGECYERW
jgi:hypothetical protein